MSTQEMTRFRLRLIESADLKSFDIFLVEEAAGDEPRIAAQTAVSLRQSSLGRMSEAQLDHDAIFDAAEAETRRVMTLEEVLDLSSLGDFAAFRGVDTARGAISDAAYSWLLMNVVQTYEKGTIDIDETHFVIRGSGKALAPQAARGGIGGKSGSGRARPKRAKKPTHSWF